jgi:hypothetical protein
MKTAGRPQEIIANFVRWNEADNGTRTIDHIFLKWLWEDFTALQDEVLNLKVRLAMTGDPQNALRRIDILTQQVEQWKEGARLALRRAERAEAKLERDADWHEPSFRDGMKEAAKIIAAGGEISEDGYPDPVSAMAALKESVGGALDDVDPMELLKELRHDDDDNEQ